MFTFDEGRQAVLFARNVVESHVTNKPLPSIKKNTFFTQKRGVFVTLHTFPNHELRGCIGIPEPVMSLQNAIIEAGGSVTHDPRFLPVSEKELDMIIVEITLLTKPKPLIYKDSKDLLKKITIGKDGLIIRYRGRSGLLLPQVPVEQKWDVEDYLTNLCFKAGLAPDTWFEREATLLHFHGQIFSETKPRGPIEERSIA